MAKTRLVHQFGMGTSIRSRDYTEACARGIRDALWHNSVNVADAFGFPPREAMLIDVEIGVQNLNRSTFKRYWAFSLTATHDYPDQGRTRR